MLRNRFGETVLRATENVVAGLPTVECTACHFEADHFLWYEDAGYGRRKLRFCPRCGRTITGVVVRGA